MLSALDAEEAADAREAAEDEQRLTLAMRHMTVDQARTSVLVGRMRGKNHSAAPNNQR